MLFADCINDHANYILMFMIKLIQHVNNSSQYIDACAHGNSAYLVVIQPQLVQQQSITYIYTNRWYYSLDGLIRRYRVLPLMVWGPLLPSPIIRTRGVVELWYRRLRQSIRCRCRKATPSGWLSKPIVRSHPCAIRVETFITIPGPFYHRYTIPRLILRR